MFAKGDVMIMGQGPSAKRYVKGYLKNRANSHFIKYINVFRQLTISFRNLK